MMSPEDLERATWLLGPWVWFLADVVFDADDLNSTSFSPRVLYS